MNVTEKLTEIEDQVLEAVSSAQEPVVTAVKKAIEAAEGRIPELKIQLNENLPRVHELVDTQYAFAGKVLENSKQFVTALLDAVQPAIDKVVEPKPAKVVKAAKSVKAA